VADPLFVPEGDAWVPDVHARGPWDPDALHGGAPSALLTRAMEALPTPGPMAFTRVTIDILRPVPMAPLEVRAVVARGGRRVQLVEAGLSAGGEAVCRATAWRVRRAEEPVVDAAAIEPPPGRPEDAHPLPLPPDLSHESFGGHAVEQRWVEGDWGRGPSVVWMRLRAPVVAGESPSPTQLAVAVADFGNGVSAVVPWSSHVFINTDLTVYLERVPEGEWVALRARTRLDPGGTGVAESVLYDTRGRIGRALQGLYVARR